MDFQITDLLNFGRERCRPNHEFGGIRNYYVIHFVLNGKGTYRVADKNWTLRKNDAFLIRPDEQHLYQADAKDPWEYLWICFSGDIEEILRGLKMDETRLCTHFKNLDRIIAYHAQLEKKIIYQNPSVILSNLGFAHLIVSEFLFEGSERVETQARPSRIANNHVMGMRCFIEQNYMDPVTVNDVVNYIQLERSYASNLFKKAMDISIMEYMQNMRLEKALKLLNSSYSMKEISYSCGFSKYQNFLSLFKKRFGITPARYREEYYGKS